MAATGPRADLFSARQRRRLVGLVYVLWLWRQHCARGGIVRPRRHAEPLSGSDMFAHRSSPSPRCGLFALRFLVGSPPRHARPAATLALRPAPRQRSARTACASDRAPALARSCPARTAAAATSAAGGTRARPASATGEPPCPGPAPVPRPRGRVCPASLPVRRALPGRGGGTPGTSRSHPAKRCDDVVAACRRASGLGGTQGARPPGIADPRRPHAKHAPSVSESRASRPDASSRPFHPPRCMRSSKLVSGASSLANRTAGAGAGPRGCLRGRPARCPW